MSQTHPAHLSVNGLPHIRSFLKKMEKLSAAIILSNEFKLLPTPDEFSENPTLLIANKYIHRIREVHLKRNGIKPPNGAEDLGAEFVSQYLRENFPMYDEFYNILISWNINICALYFRVQLNRFDTFRKISIGQMPILAADNVRASFVQSLPPVKSDNHNISILIEHIQKCMYDANALYVRALKEKRK